MKRTVRFPIRLKIMISLLFAVTLVVSVITLTMARLFHDDKRSYMKDWVSIAALSTAEECSFMLQGYAEKLELTSLILLNEEITAHTAIRDDQIVAQIVDYSESYPQIIPNNLGEVSYADLKTGSITIQGKKVPTGGISSYMRAREIAAELKSWIQDKKFLLSESVAPLPSTDSDVKCKLLNERPVKKKK